MAGIKPRVIPPGVSGRDLVEKISTRRELVEKKSTRAKRRCSSCGEPDHDVRHCPKGNRTSKTRAPEAPTATSESQTDVTLRIRVIVTVERE